MKYIRSFIFNYLQKEYTFPNDDIDTINYLESGYIDSLSMIKFVIELEDKFSIKFTDEELSSPDFQIVGGLIHLVKSKVKQKESV
jgi:acyl carrier protein